MVLMIMAVATNIRNRALVLRKEMAGPKNRVLKSPLLQSRVFMFVFIT